MRTISSPTHQRPKRARKNTDIPPLVIKGDYVEQVSNFHFVGVHIEEGLTWIPEQLGGAEKKAHRDSTS